MSFKSLWVLLLLVVPLLFMSAYWIFLRKKVSSLKMSSLSFFSDIPRGVRAYLVELPLYLKILASIFIVLALARPQESETKVKRNVEGIDIMMVIDISDSMLIEDMQPKNRMESAKKTVEEFIKKREFDRIGVTVFSGEAYTRVPLTLDYDILLDSVKQIEPQRAVKMGTAIGVALASAVGRIKDSTAKTRVIVLLTDGENNTGTIDPLTALDIAKGYKIRIYTIGIGKDGEAQLPVYQTDPFGRRVKTYQPIYSAVNDDLLDKMARETGGKYFRVTKTDVLQNVFKEIDSLEKSKVEVNTFTRYTELFQKYLKWAFFFYTLALVFEYSLFRRGP